MSGNHPPPGVAVGKPGIEAARLVLQLRILCRDHGVNSISELPSEPFQRAMSMQAQIDQLRIASLDALKDRGRRGLAIAHEKASLRAAARFNEFRSAVAARGGLEAVNKLRLAKELGISRTTVQSLCKRLRAEQTAGPPVCPACGQRVPEPENFALNARREAEARRREQT